MSFYLWLAVICCVVNAPLGALLCIALHAIYDSDED